MSTCILRFQAVSPCLGARVTLASDPLELQQLHLTLAAVMVSLGAEYTLQCSWLSSEHALAAVNHLRKALGLSATGTLVSELDVWLGTIEGLPQTIDLPRLQELAQARPWQLMARVQRGRHAAPVMAQLVARTIDFHSPAHVSLQGYALASPDVRVMTNLLKDQRKARTPDYYLPTPGKFQCLDRLEAVLQALGSSEVPGFFLMDSQTLEL